MLLIEQAKRAKAASYQMLTLSTQVKDCALAAMADALMSHVEGILTANRTDLAAAAEAGRKDAFLDRLALSETRIAGMAGGLRKLAFLPDPIGQADEVLKRPNGLSIEKRRVPLGVIGIIYEARPNVTSDALGLCLKSSNACIVRGGSEAIATNTAVSACLIAAAEAAGIPQGALQFVSDPSRETAKELMHLNGYLDVLIPRGGVSLIRSVIAEATVPVIETGLGVCHAYVDASADVAMAADIVYNGKCSRPSVCNALETLLVHREIAQKALPAIEKRLSEKKVELRGCERTRTILHGILAAEETDWSTEYDDYILSVKVVDSIEDAIAHINRYGTHHSDVIVTESYEASEHFLNAVDSATVYVNASTRFTDGEEFGLGAEIGISTQKLHARGPMGLHELTSYKYVVRGNGQTR